VWEVDNNHLNPRLDQWLQHGTAHSMRHMAFEAAVSTVAKVFLSVSAAATQPLASNSCGRASMRKNHDGPNHSRVTTLAAALQPSSLNT
jgi:hypothetical protein